MKPASDIISRPILTEKASGLAEGAHAVRVRLLADADRVDVDAGFFALLERLLHLFPAGLIDAVAFGRSFISNPDLVRRLKLNAPLQKANSATNLSLAGTNMLVAFREAANPVPASDVPSQAARAATNYATTCLGAAMTSNLV